MTTPTAISDRIVESILARRPLPGARLGEQQLASVFECSRTLVREALTALAVRGIVTVNARRGWYVVELSKDEAREAFEARAVIETGLLRRRRPDAAGLRRLREHLARQQAALETWEAKLPMPVETDPVEQLRQALRPVDEMAPILHTRQAAPARASHSQPHASLAATR